MNGRGSTICGPWARPGPGKPSDLAAVVLRVEPTETPMVEDRPRGRIVAAVVLRDKSWPAALVTGAASDPGTAAAARLARRGAHAYGLGPERVFEAGNPR
ncbi:hypothetical protein [Streptomyces sp. NPDC057545]|uniref:hypothetical protein n=1 Tax=Streptomyces sp. NPDC057545 TaxID=3346164 RepID=UPI0036939ECA